MNGDLEKLIPELRKWNEGKGIDVESWIYCVGNYEHAIGYLSIFWPKFTFYEGCVFFHGFSVESYDGFMEQTAGNKKSVESAMNHRHILDFFQNVESEPTEQQIIYLGRILQEVWQSKLDRDFPDLKIIVSFPVHGIEDMLDYETTIFQEHDG